jgi:hypothetical protein
MLAGSPPDAADLCQLRLRSRQEERWAYYQYWTDGEGKPHDLDVRFSSEVTYGDDVRFCAEQGQLELSSEGPGYHETFQFTAPADAEDVEGQRKIRLRFPAFGGLGGDLAIRLEVTREGEVVEKSILFTTDRELGQLVLEHIASSLEFVRTGENRGPFVDVFFLKFQKGDLAVAIHRYFALKAPPEA